MRKKKKAFLLILTISFLFQQIQAQHIFTEKEYRAIQFSASDKIILKKLLQKEGGYDGKEKMITRKITEYQYHIDAVNVVYHEIRGSFYYALALLNTGDTDLYPKAFTVIDKCLSLQDKNPKSPTCGIWAYYLEEPLQTKKSPPDFNMADFNAVTLIDIWLGFHKKLPADLKTKMQSSLLLAAYSIKKRDVAVSYTNIALMGTYVTYMAGRLFKDFVLMNYSSNKLKEFYNYTLSKNGFREYNSPNYTITAMEELNRMQQHFIEPKDKAMADSLYHLAWQMIGRHYHTTTGQWAGPHSRSYSSIVNKSFYNLLAEATNYKLMKEDTTLFNYTTFRRYTHHMPPDVKKYFINPVYPRTEIDLFEPDTPQVKGISYLTKNFTLSSCNQSSLWNQRRPLIAYWGSFAKPQYLQVRLLHNLYDFSSAVIKTTQEKNKVLAAVNFNIGMGDKHITIDKISDGKFIANDIRLRFELGYTKLADNTTLPASFNEPFTVELSKDLVLQLCLFAYQLDNTNGYWEKGSDGKNSWLDFVFYKGKDTVFDMHTIQNCIAAFTLSIQEKNSNQAFPKPVYNISNKIFTANWNGLVISTQTNIIPISKDGTWF